MKRREFMTGAAIAAMAAAKGALAASSPQLELARYLPRTDDNQLENSHPRLGGDFIYGTHFYHPQSGPRPDQFRAMIEAIVHKYQFKMIRIFLPWDYYNPKRGVFDFEVPQQLLSICDEVGVRVLMNVMLESAPYWLEQAHPETRLVNARGEALHLGGSAAHYSGGAPGLCFDWQVVQDAAASFVRELVKVSVSHPSLYGYDIWNEPAYVDIDGQELRADIPISDKLFCYCDRTIAEFQNWLQRRYGTIDRLNEAWIRRYPDWKAIDPPRRISATYGDWLDWLHFIQESTTEYLRFRTKTVREIDPSHVIETHTAYSTPTEPSTLRGIQQWRLAEEVEVFGCSFYPNAWGWPIDQAAAQIEIVRSCAMGKDFWVTEMQGNHGSAGYMRDGPMLPRAIRLWNWLAVAAGAKGIIYWTYLTEGTGGEAGGFGLVSRNGATTERVEEAAKANRLIQARWSLLKDHRPRPEIAILFDQDNALLTFAGNGNEDPCAQSARGYYKAFWSMDFWVDFIEPAQINNSQYKVLVVSWHLIGKKATCDAIRQFAEQGGTVILETAFGRFDANYYFNPVIPGNGLDEIFGYREQDSLMVGNLPIWGSGSGIADEVEITLTKPVSVRVKADTYLTPIEISSATPIGTCRQWTVAAMKRVGKGMVYYFGTNLGGSIAKGDPGGIDLLRALVADVVRPAVSSSGALRPRLIQGSTSGLLTVFNYSDSEQRATITVPTGYKRAINVYSGEQHVIKANKLDISVPIKDVGVFDLD